MIGIYLAWLFGVVCGALFSCRLLRYRTPPEEYQRGVLDATADIALAIEGDPKFAGIRSKLVEISKFADERVSNRHLQPTTHN